MTQPFELRVDSIAAGGDGVGRHDGIVVFVPRTAPGDVARVRAKPGDRLMRGELLEILERSDARVQPPCPHYVQDRCGGCQLQHMSYQAQLNAKSRIIRDVLLRIGKVDAEAPVVEPSTNQWRYRRKLTLALRRRGDRWIAGLHRYDAPGDVFELNDCPITDDRVMSVWKAIMERQDLLPDARELRGAVRALDVQFSFTLEGARRWTRNAAFFDAIPALEELWWAPEGRSRRLLRSRSAGGKAGASFVQVNEATAARLRSWVLTLADAIRPATAVDAYAGNGVLSQALAERGVRVTAIEVDRDAARVARVRLPEGSRVLAARVEEALPSALPAHLVVLNPPRTGVDERVAATLSAIAEKPRAVVYVSCNPATLARDLRRLRGYEVRSLRGFDMFPQTAHVETVCELVPAA